MATRLMKPRGLMMSVDHDDDHLDLDKDYVKLEYARCLRDNMRNQLHDHLSSDDVLKLGDYLRIGIRNHAMVIHNYHVSDELIKKLELLSGPNAYAVLKALIARGEL
jgi:hypothetical protein